MAASRCFYSVEYFTGAGVQSSILVKCKGYLDRMLLKYNFINVHMHIGNVEQAEKEGMP